MIRRPPRSTLDRSSAASDVYKRQYLLYDKDRTMSETAQKRLEAIFEATELGAGFQIALSLIHISEPTRPY